MKWIPAAKSGKWWGIAAGMTIIVGAAIWLIRFVHMGQVFTGVYAFRMLLLAAVVSFAFSAAGWFGARWLWGFSNAGLIAGLAAMALYGSDKTGWEDLISFLSFMMVTVGGIAVGIVAEVVVAVLRYRKTR
ncbi:hypothetical protein D3P07_23525 [Paenibacillus sp. 1011MAR3C5]|uniref:hypothetical protein n=1 Tax=Paenibacillus sp. 1011MAR3C5 TaxID=1675787 RepID=UPI000E6D1EDE|nr:hypothetical protein [Paenibacillus sp. 1011MAR3C5]RJE84338.1 hypothetical protein D3P07_23525 [Paenibacillus sp. 1011MAR3C5]